MINGIYKDITYKLEGDLIVVSSKGEVVERLSRKGLRLAGFINRKGEYIVNLRNDDQIDYIIDSISIDSIEKD